jgi:hypothetical protein
MWLLILLMVVIILALIERRINLQLEEKQSLQRMREIHDFFSKETASLVLAEELLVP